MHADGEGHGITTKRLVARLDPARLADGCSFAADGNLIVFKDPVTGQIVAGPNRCRHQGGRFRRTGASEMTCPRHGWTLDAATMRYVDPLGVTHPRFDLVELDDGLVGVLETPAASPWEEGLRSPEPLEAGEMTIRFLTHACVEIVCGTARILTDPWLVGPAFTRGWWLAHHPPAGWVEMLGTADAIYISHNHADHLSMHTLRILAREAPDVPIFVPAFDGGSCEALVRRAGMRNVLAAPFLQWLELGPDSRFMILPDASGRDDSALLVDYRGHLVLNTVDCQNVNNGHLPEVEVLLTNFAGGASGFPVCWDELYGEDEIRRKVDTTLASLLRAVVDTTRAAAPAVYAPFAGYFVEAHPSDADIRRRNRKNTPESAAAAVRRASPTTSIWLPADADLFDVGLRTSQTTRPLSRTSWDDEFATYLPLFEPRPLDMEQLERYVAWTGYRGDRVLHVIETDERLTQVEREYVIDFATGSLSRTPPRGDRPYTRMRVRAGSFHHVLREGLPWDEITIGFQARLFREPDVYDFPFWNHMQDGLPTEPPVLG